MEETNNGTTEIVVRGWCVKRGQVLVCRSKKYGHLFLPGGHVEFAEGARSALAREWREEMHLDCRVGGLLGVSEQTYLSRGGTKTHEFSLVFSVACPAAKIANPPAGVEGHISFEWIPVARLAAERVLPLAQTKALNRWIRDGAGYVGG